MSDELNPYDVSAMRRAAELHKKAQNSPHYAEQPSTPPATIGGMCEHISYNGTRCGYPALELDTLCLYHSEKYANSTSVPVSTDATEARDSAGWVLDNLICGMDGPELFRESSNLSLMKWKDGRSAKLRDVLTAFAAPLRTQLEEAKGEVAACLQFLETELGWDSFRVEMLYASDTKENNSSRNNAQLLKNYLAETGHGIAFRKKLAAAERELTQLRTEWAAAQERGKVNAQLIGIEEVDGVLRNVRAESAERELTQLRQEVKRFKDAYEPGDCRWYSASVTEGIAKERDQLRTDLLKTTNNLASELENVIALRTEKERLEGIVDKSEEYLNSMEQVPLATMENLRRLREELRALIQRSREVKP